MMTFGKTLNRVQTRKDVKSPNGKMAMRKKAPAKKKR